MSVAEFRENLRSIVEDLGGLKTGWENQDRKYVPPDTRAHMLLSFTQWGGDVAVDELRFSTAVNEAGDPILDSGGNEQIVASVVGRRDAIVEVRCESFSQADENVAEGYLDTLMSKLKLPAGQAALVAANIALQGFGAAGALNVDESLDQRVRSVAVLELLLGTVVCVEEEPNNCWIQQVLVTSKVKDPAGQLLPVPPNFNNLLIDGGA